MNIEIDFEVYKAITLRRITEDTSPNDVLRSLLNLPEATFRSVDLAVDAPESGIVAAGRMLPDGTQLRTVYKGQPYSAKIAGGQVVTKEGKSLKSLSAAAFSITGSKVNGLRFWKAKRPADHEWATVATIPVPTP